jgi:hypothetical protein
MVTAVNECTDNSSPSFNGSGKRVPRREVYMHQRTGSSKDSNKSRRSPYPAIQRPESQVFQGMPNIGVSDGLPGSTDVLLSTPMEYRRGLSPRAT